MRINTRGAWIQCGLEWVVPDSVRQEGVLVERGILKGARAFELRPLRPLLIFDLLTLISRCASPWRSPSTRTTRKGRRTHILSLVCTFSVNHTLQPLLILPTQVWFRIIERWEEMKKNYRFLTASISVGENPNMHAKQTRKNIARGFRFFLHLVRNLWLDPNVTPFISYLVCEISWTATLRLHNICPLLECSLCWANPFKGKEGSVQIGTSCPGLTVTVWQGYSFSNVTKL